MGSTGVLPTSKRDALLELKRCLILFLPLNYYLFLKRKPSLEQFHQSLQNTKSTKNYIT